MLSRVLSAFIVILAFPSLGLGQQAGVCKAVEVPMSVIGPSGDVFRGLAAEDFVGRLQKKPVNVKLVTYDDGPRRVLLVVDVNKKLSADSRKAESEMIRIILENARPQDAFALIPAHGNGQQVKFTTDRSAITLALGAAGGGKAGKEPGVLDSVMEGMEWFEGRQSGDSIVVIAADTEGNRKANARLVGSALEERHIRMFGLSLGPVATQSSVAGGTVTSTTSQGLAYAKPLVGALVYDTGDEHFFPLAVNSGGLLLGVLNMDDRRSYSLSDPAVLQAVRQKALAVSKMVSAYYRMQIEPPQLQRPQDWSLTIKEEMQKHTQQMFVLYPRQLGPC